LVCETVPRHRSERKKRRQQRRNEVEPDKSCDGSAAGHGREGLIGGFDESMGKGDALGFIAFKNGFIGPALKNSCQFPGKIDRVTDA
jgi:hypothetical protein